MPRVGNGGSGSKKPSEKAANGLNPYYGKTPHRTGLSKEKYQGGGLIEESLLRSAISEHHRRRDKNT